MLVKVEMSEEEMAEFLDFRKNKRKNNSLKNELIHLAKKVFWAIGVNESGEGYHIEDQDHAEELYSLATEILE